MKKYKLKIILNDKQYCIRMYEPLEQSYIKSLINQEYSCGKTIFITDDLDKVNKKFEEIKIKIKNTNSKDCVLHCVKWPVCDCIILREEDI